MSDDPIYPDILFFSVDDQTIGLSVEDAELLGLYLIEVTAQLEILRSYVDYFIEELEYIESIK
jgi:hypothetical protein